VAAVSHGNLSRENSRQFSPPAPDDVGAAWTFTRSGNAWTQQGDKLVGSGVVGSAQQGFSVALSSDGNTAVVRALEDNSYTGAAWVFTRSNGSWTQQGAKLVGSGAVGGSEQGVSVSLSADGNTAMVGWERDNSYGGAAWVFTRTRNGVWTQQGNKLAGSGAVGAAQLVARVTRTEGTVSSA
jgi:hypothetical protein